MANNLLLNPNDFEIDEFAGDEDHGWAAVFIDEKFVKADRDIVDCVWLD